MQLAIRSETVTPEEVAAATGLMPTRQFRRGEPMFAGRDAVYRFHGWFLAPAGYGPGDVETKVRDLLDRTEAAAAAIRALSATCWVSVIVGYHGYQHQMSGLAIGAPDLARLAALGAVLDVDLYASGPDWDP